MALILGRIPRDATGMAARDREWLALLDTTLPAEQRADVIEPMLAMPAPDPAYLERVNEVFAELDALADTELAEDDPAVDELARRLIELTPPQLLPRDGVQMPGDDDPFGRAFFADLSPGQAVVIRRVIQLLARP